MVLIVVFVCLARRGGEPMVVLYRIYTRTGDGGDTALGDGTRVPKHAPRVAAYGTVDELNATLGLARLHAGASSTPALARVQNDLFDLGADLCTPDFENDAAAPRRGSGSSPPRSTRLEAEIDAMNAGLAPLRSFVLPGGTALAAHLHLGRTVCRRAERLVVELAARDGQSGSGALPQPPVGLALRRRPHRQRRRPRRRALGAGRQPLIAPRWTGGWH